MNNDFSTISFKEGVKDGLPIGLGYFPVAFAFGVKASLNLVPVFITLLISLTNLTSAGQLAGLNIIIAGGGFLEIIVTELIINSRYFLMSISLSQKVDNSFTVKNRFFCSTFITDEIFAVAVSKPNKISVNYFLGLSLLPYIGWALGTLFGAVAGNILPAIIASSLGLALYAMFIAIIIPPATKEIGVLVVILLSALISCLFYFIPVLTKISSGMAIIISAVFASIICALIFPKTVREVKSDD